MAATAASARGSEEPRRRAWKERWEKLVRRASRRVTKRPKSCVEEKEGGDKNVDGGEACCISGLQFSLKMKRRRRDTCLVNAFIRVLEVLRVFLRRR